MTHSLYLFTPQGKIVRPNIECTNGYIHLVDTVMMDDSPPWTVLAASEASSTVSTLLLILPLLILQQMQWTNCASRSYLSLQTRNAQTSICSTVTAGNFDRHYPCFIIVSYNRANKHMESKPSQFVPKVVNFLRHIFCLAVWRFSGLPITIRKRVRPLFRPLAGLMFPVCATIAKLR